MADSCNNPLTDLTVRLELEHSNVINSVSFSRDKDTDITIQIGDISIPCHKDVLCSRSPYFEAMFSGLYQESSCDKIDLTNTVCSVDAFNVLLDYMYTGTLIICDRLLSELVEVSSILLLDECKIKLCKYLKYNLTVNNALRYWLITYRYFEEYLSMSHNLLTATFHNWHIYQEETFYLSSEDVLCLLRKNVHECCSPQQLMKFVLQWCNRRPPPRHDITTLTPILDEIDNKILQMVVNIDSIEFTICEHCTKFIVVIHKYLKSKNDIDLSIQSDTNVDSNESNDGVTSDVNPQDEFTVCSCDFEFLRHMNPLEVISNLNTEIDVLLIGGPSYTTLDHKFDLFSQMSDIHLTKQDRSDFLDVSVYIPGNKVWLNIGGIPFSHGTATKSIEFADRECSIHYVDNKLYFRKASKQTLFYDLTQKKVRNVPIQSVKIDSTGVNVKFIGSFVANSDYYCFVTKNDVNEYYIIKLVDDNNWKYIMGPFSPLNTGDVRIFDVVTQTENLDNIIVMFITKVPNRSLFSGHIFTVNLPRRRMTKIAQLGEYLVEPFHWNISRQRNHIHLVHKATVMYTLNMDDATPMWRANEEQVCLEGYLPSMKNSRCGQLVCHSLFTTSKQGLWILANRKIRGQFSMGCLNHVDLSRMPEGCVEEQPPPPYSIFTFMTTAKMSVEMLTRLRDSRLYHRYSIWE